MSDTMVSLLLLSGVIALGFLFAVSFYESLSTRDVLIRRTTRLARRVSSRQWVLGATYLVTVGIGIPVLVLIWTVILELALVFVGSVDRLGNVAVVAVAVVAAARILAYARQATSHELAKAIPLALAFVLLTGGNMNLEQNLARILERPEQSALTDEMIAFLIVLEVGLRLVTDTSRLALASIRRRRGIESDLGAWRTLWAAIRRPLRSVSGEVPDVERVEP